MTRSAGKVRHACGQTTVAKCVLPLVNLVVCMGQICPPYATGTWCDTNCFYHPCTNVSAGTTWKSKAVWTTDRCKCQCCDRPSKICAPDASGPDVWYSWQCSRNATNGTPPPWPDSVHIVGTQNGTLSIMGVEIGPMNGPLQIWSSCDPGQPQLAKLKQNVLANAYGATVLNTTVVQDCVGAGSGTFYENIA
eukprot:COSAG02_NODE_11474_length_1717_cov_2.361557_2_plen_192_part_00